MSYSHRFMGLGISGKALSRGAITAACGIALAIALPARADMVLILGGNTTPDTNELAAQTALEALGHTTVTIGASISTFTGAGLSGYNAVVLLNGDGTGEGYNMPLAGQNALLSFINAGGGLVTSEWSVWGNADFGASSTLAAAYPVVPSVSYDSAASLGYNQATANAIVDNGLPSSFTFGTDNDGGTETLFAPAAGATTFFTTSGSTFGGTPGGLIGGSYGSGHVASFSTLIGPNELGNPDYAQLFSNSVTWAESPATTAVPEPASVGLLIGMSALGFLGIGRKRKGGAGTP